MQGALTWVVIVAVLCIGRAYAGDLTASQKSIYEKDFREQCMKELLTLKQDTKFKRSTLEHYCACSAREVSATLNFQDIIYFRQHSGTYSDAAMRIIEEKSDYCFVKVVPQRPR